MPRPAARAARRVCALARRTRASLVLIDGPSGAGKSTLADAIVAEHAAPVELIRLDEVYPGWGGLIAASRLLRQGFVAPRERGAIGRVERWDWEANAAASPRFVVPGLVAIVEGCGAFAAASDAASARTVRIWVDAPDDVRRERALTRDAGAFDDFWHMWDVQWRRYVLRWRPRRIADLRVRVGPDRWSGYC